jgi:sulfate/thiosulfate transport system substrate-binding protein
MIRTPARVAALILAPTLALSACGGGGTADTAAQCNGVPDQPVISFAAYSAPREAYGKIISAFKADWKDTHDGQEVIFQESYDGSTLQASRVVGGYEADVVALSLGPDVDEIADAGLITHDWAQEADGGMVTTSVVVFDVRPGNPLGIQDWDDLAKPGVEVLTPDPASSGGARWNLVSAWGAALRGYGGVSEGDEGGATTLMQGVLGNVIAFDSSARKSIQNFEDGNGDVAITYENEIVTAQAAGKDDEAVYPPSSVLIENPVTVVDEIVDKHCVRPVAEAFVKFLHTDEVKQIFLDSGYRSTDVGTAQKGGGDLPAIDDLWDVDEFGGWDALNDKLFGDAGIATQAMAG